MHFKLQDLNYKMTEYRACAKQTKCTPSRCITFALCLLLYSLVPYGQLYRFLSLVRVVWSSVNLQVMEQRISKLQTEPMNSSNIACRSQKEICYLHINIAVLLSFSSGLSFANSYYLVIDHPSIRSFSSNYYL